MSNWGIFAPPPARPANRLSVQGMGTRWPRGHPCWHGTELRALPAAAATFDVHFGGFIDSDPSTTFSVVVHLFGSAPDLNANPNVGSYNAISAGVSATDSRFQRPRPYRTSSFRTTSSSSGCRTRFSLRPLMPQGAGS